MRHFLPTLILLLVMVIPSLASAFDGPLQPPTLVEGQHVYSIPEGYLPKEVTRAKAEQLEGTLDALHGNFYVFFVETLPRLDSTQAQWGRSHGFRGDEPTLRAEVGYAMLALDLQTGSPDIFDANVDSGFVLAGDPRKFSWSPGSDYWDAPVDVPRGRKQDAYTKHFLRKATRNPSDPAGGIGLLFQKLDEHIFDMTDPHRIAEREDRHRQQQETRRLRAAQGQLDTEILHLAELLGDTEHLPADVATFQDTLTEARQVRRRNDPAEMLGEAEEMQSTVTVLEGYVSERRSEARAAFAAGFFKWLFIGVIALLILFLLVRRFREQDLLKTTFQNAWGDWDNKIANANNKWSDHYLNREDLTDLNDLKGATKKLWDQTTQDVDAILVRIRAMQKHGADVALIFSRGHWFNFTPYKSAALAMGRSFDFDTGVINDADLFGGDTVTLTVNPATFADETGILFSRSIEGWRRLKEAAAERIGEASDDFRHIIMDNLFELAEARNIPERWFNDHPLFGDDTSDQLLYDRLNNLRKEDPLAYVEEIKKLKILEGKIVRRMERVVKALILVAGNRVDSPFDTSDTNVSPEDDPANTIAAARQREDQMAGLLVSGSLAEVEGCSKSAAELYLKTVKQGAEIKSAIQGATASLAAAKAQSLGASASLKSADGVVRASAKNHRRVSSARDSLTSASQFLHRGNSLVDAAQSELGDSRHLDARRIADRATSTFASVEQACLKAKAHCLTLDREKAAYVARRVRMPDVRGSYARKMRRFDSYARSLAAVTYPSESSGPTDYNRLLQELNAQESGWRRTTRAAEGDYETEQRRLRKIAEAAARKKREEEAARRRERDAEAAEARRRRSSSSSSSHGGGGFGGSSGSSGGGGFGGSSGSW